MLFPGVTIFIQIIRVIEPIGKLLFKWKIAYLRRRAYVSVGRNRTPSLAMTCAMCVIANTKTMSSRDTFPRRAIFIQGEGYLTEYVFQTDKRLRQLEKHSPT